MHFYIGAYIALERQCLDTVGLHVLLFKITNDFKNQVNQ